MRNEKNSQKASAVRLLAVLLALCCATSCRQHSGKVIDADTGRPIAGATVVHNGHETHSNADGRFAFRGIDLEKPLLAKAPGYGPASQPMAKVESWISLRQFSAKGAYLSYAALKSSESRAHVLALAREGGLNTLVVDVKGDAGQISFGCQTLLARLARDKELPPIHNLKAWVQQLHDLKLYVIGRIVVFKDTPLARYKPQWAVVDGKTNKAWSDRRKQFWMDPFRDEVWDYNLALAAEAAQAGFDEIQFDYLRFPMEAAGRLKFSKEPLLENRQTAITGFLDRAHSVLRPWNVNISVTVFASELGDQRDVLSGLSLEDLLSKVDYVCPTVYPASYRSGFAGVADPATQPGEIVRHVLKNAIERLDAHASQLRPWLQNFSDARSRRHPFTEKEIAAEIAAVNQFATGGWLLWDADGQYEHTGKALKLILSEKRKDVKNP